MRGEPVGAERRARTFDAPPPMGLLPDAALMTTGLFEGLLMLVVAGRLAEGLKVRLRPEQFEIATVRLDVVTDQLRRVALDAPAVVPLAGKPIALEHFHPRARPGRCVVKPTKGRGIAPFAWLGVARSEGQTIGCRCQPGRRG